MTAAPDPTAAATNHGTNLPDRNRDRNSVVGPVLVGVALAVLIAIFKVLGISLKFEALTFVGLYLSIGVQSVAYAVLLIAIQFPKEILLPNLKRLLRRPEVIVAGLALGVLFFKLFPVDFALPLLVAVLLVFAIPFRAATSVLLPGAYLFGGLLTAFCYSVVGVTVRFEPNYDAVLQRIDYYLLFGHSVSQISHQFAAMAPSFVPSVLLVWYALMFPQVGAVLMICSAMVGRSYAMKFVSTILLAYLLSVVVFFVFPTHSPYFTCPDHTVSKLPAWMIDFQENYVRTATARFHGLRSPVGPEYYISFPCMHIAQPLIAMWYLRRWRRVLTVLIPVNVLLGLSIVLLEWHYAVDLMGGALVAAGSILLIEKLTSSERSTIEVA